MGIAATPFMPVSDVYVGWVSSLGTPTLLDCWSPDYLQPQPDTAQGGRSDTTLLAAFESNGGTTMQFTRRLVTGDSRDVTVTNGTLSLLWAYNTQDGVGAQYSKHVATGSARVVFWGNSDASGSGPSVPTGPVASNSTQLAAIVARVPQFNSSSGNLKAWWSINASSGEFTLTMQGRTNGWISFGFGDTPLMVDADMMVSLICRYSIVSQFFGRNATLS